MLTALLVFASVSASNHTPGLPLGSVPKAGAVVVTFEPPSYYQEREKNAAPDAKRIRKETFQYLGDGIVVFQTDVLQARDVLSGVLSMSGELWVYIPGKGEREFQDLSLDERKDIIRRQKEYLKKLGVIIDPPTPEKILTA